MDKKKQILHIEESLERFGGAVDLYKEILADFSNPEESILENFKKSLNTKDYEQLKQQTHKLKGLLGTIGCELLYDALKNFEILLKNPQETELSFAFSEIEQLFTKTNEAIKQYLAKS